MKKKFFDGRLYLDALKQLRLIGIMGLVILTLEAIIIPIGLYLQVNPYCSTDFLKMHPLLLLCFCVIAPLMTLYLFNFLNKRNSSDFYHAIPNTRISLFVSFMAAILTWLTAIIVISSAVSVLGHQIYFMTGTFNTVYNINFTSVFVMMFNVWAGSILVAASVAIAMCVSGTVFTNVVVSGLLIFMPRLLILVFTGCLSGNLPVISGVSLFPPLDSEYNVVTNLIFGVFEGGATRSVDFLPGGLYTLALGVVYLFAAAWLFHTRKSEAAGQSAPNRVLQCLYRLLIAMVVCLFACVPIVQDILNGNTISNSEIFSYIVVYIIAVLAYFIYELVTTRRWKNLLRSIPALGILVLMNVTFIGSIIGAYHSVLSFTPETEEIISVQLTSGSSGYGTKRFFSAKADEVRHESEEIRRIVSCQLKETVELVKNQQYRSALRNENIQMQQVVIHTKNRTMYRNILVASSDMQSLMEELSQNEQVRDIYMNLPPIQELSTISIGPLPKAEVRQVYEMLREELKTIPFETWYAYLHGISIRSDSKELSTEFTSFDGAAVNFSGMIGTKSFVEYFQLPIFLPKTCNLFMELSNAQVNQTQRQQLWETLEQHKWAQEAALTITAYNLQDAQGNPVGTLEMYYHGNMPGAYYDSLKALAAEGKENVGQKPDITKPLYQITFTCFGDGSKYESGYADYVLYFNVSDNQIPEVLFQYSVYDDVVVDEVITD